VRCIPHGSQWSKRTPDKNQLNTSEPMVFISSIKNQDQMHIYTPERRIRESLSFKQHEAYLLETRDSLCKHYKLNKSDLIKYLIKKEHQNLKSPDAYLFKWNQNRNGSLWRSRRKQSTPSPTNHPSGHPMRSWRKHSICFIGTWEAKRCSEASRIPWSSTHRDQMPWWCCWRTKDLIRRWSEQT